MKIIIVLLLTLSSCAFQIDGPQTPGDTMVPEHGWSPDPKGGFDPTHNYNLPSSLQKNKVPLGWQQSTRLQSSNVALGQLKNFFSSDFPEAGIYTAMFSIVAPSQLPGGLPPIQPTSTIRCQAVLSWVIEGSQVQRIFDIGNGTTISGAGAGAIIQVQDLTATLIGAAGTNGVEYQVTVAVAKGTRAQFQVPLIIPGSENSNVLAGIPIVGPVTLGAGVASLWNVPKNAGVISVKVSALDFTTPATAPTFVQAFQNSGPNGTGSILYSWLPDRDFSFVPLVPGVQSVTVTNRAAADAATIALDWGIDG